MSDFFSLFNPGHEHLRRQKELEKVLFVDSKKGGRGPQPLDLESGSVTIELPPRTDAGAGASASGAGPHGTPGRDTQHPSSNDANFASSDEDSVS